MGFSSLVLGLALLVPAAAPASYQVGDRITVVQNAPLKVGRTVVEHAAPGVTLRVDVTNGRWLWVTGKKPGWIDRKYVIPHSRAAKYFAAAVKRDPKNAALMAAQRLVREASDATPTTLDLDRIVRNFENLLKSDQATGNESALNRHVEIDVDRVLVGMESMQARQLADQRNAWARGERPELRYNGSNRWFNPFGGSTSVESFHNAVLCFAMTIENGWNGVNQTKPDANPSPTFVDSSPASPLVVERIDFRLPVPEDLNRFHRLGFRGSSQQFGLRHPRNISSNYVEQYRAAIVLFALNTQNDQAQFTSNAFVQQEMPSPVENSSLGCDPSWLRAFHCQDAAVLADLDLPNESAASSQDNGEHRPIAISRPGRDKLLSRIQSLLDGLPVRFVGQKFRYCEPELPLQVLKAESSDIVDGLQVCHLFVGDRLMELEESVPLDECFGIPDFVEMP